MRSCRLFALLFLPSTFVHALPLHIRQNAPTTVQTVHTTQTPAGPVTETCNITLTPTTDAIGNAAVQEVKECSLAFSNQSAPESASGLTTTVVSPGSATASGLASTVVSPGPATASGLATTIPSSGPATAATSSVVVTATSTIAMSSANAPTSTSVSAPTSTATSTAQSASGVVTQSVNTPTPSGSALADENGSTSTATSATTPTNTSAQSAGTSAPDSTASASAAFQLPGKTLSVLPIGLGVFAGISVIALIVVGLVTYERTKYRKAFRQRKLAESGATMGYGGMVQRA